MFGEHKSQAEIASHVERPTGTPANCTDGVAWVHEKGILSPEFFEMPDDNRCNKTDNFGLSSLSCCLRKGRGHTITIPRPLVHRAADKYDLDMHGEVAGPMLPQMWNFKYHMNCTLEDSKPAMCKLCTQAEKVFGCKTLDPFVTFSDNTITFSHLTMNHFGEVSEKFHMFTSLFGKHVELKGKSVFTLKNQAGQSVGGTAFFDATTLGLEKTSDLDVAMSLEMTSDAGKMKSNERFVVSHSKTEQELEKLEKEERRKKKPFDLFGFLKLIDVDEPAW